MEGFPGAHFAKSANGWIDSEIFATWLSTSFVPAMAHLQKPVLLFADGHSTHLTLAMHEICREHNIILYQLPSHSSHIVQPLDLFSFKNFKQASGEKVIKFQEENSDTLTKQHFSKVFRKAWDRRATTETFSRTDLKPQEYFLGIRKSLTEQNWLLTECLLRTAMM
ncbi:Jerky protein [Plakobranchus ocellatus]|uniref:Jerky protein n=1 Tax=Plakobranchus ocellatus TaxID=259542 RepID=A0AAV4BGU5_9GAST|nr:Jerky protein [Plakobranchus ocellatus]